MNLQIITKLDFGRNHHDCVLCLFVFLMWAFDCKLQTCYCSQTCGAGMAHCRHGGYSCQDNRQAAAGLGLDLRTSVQSAAAVTGKRNCPWLQSRNSLGLHYILFQVMYSVWRECTDSHSTKISSCRTIHGRLFIQQGNCQESNPVHLEFFFFTCVF